MLISERNPLGLFLPKGLCAILKRKVQSWECSLLGRKLLASYAQGPGFKLPCDGVHLSPRHWERRSREIRSLRSSLAA